MQITCNQSISSVHQYAKNIALNYKTTLDRSFDSYWHDLQYYHWATESCTDFYNLRTKNPMLADIAMNDVIREQGITYPKDYIFHKKSLESVPNIQKLIKKSCAVIKNLYPKTAKIREKLISQNQITLNNVTPVLKGFEKQFFKLRVYI